MSLEPYVLPNPEPVEVKLTRIREKLNSLLCAEHFCIVIADGELAIGFPEVRTYLDAKCHQEKSVHPLGGTAIGGKVHLCMVMPEPTVFEGNEGRE